MHASIKITVRLLSVSLLALTVPSAFSQTNSPHHDTNAPVKTNVASNPDWLFSGQYEATSAETGATYNPLRSLLALLLVVAILFGLQYWLKRRSTVTTREQGVGPRVRSRQKLGLRQELVVIEWGDEEILVGLGPAFASRLAQRAATHKTTENGKQDT